MSHLPGTIFITRDYLNDWSHLSRTKSHGEKEISEDFPELAPGEGDVSMSPTKHSFPCQVNISILSKTKGVSKT